ncbi:TRAP transporter substrate-binding protein [Halomonas sp. ML-15]|uniref:TRAP transporter substrate-binding protein n=1 Tax=Halomonas sp. ML-15 TaxID=2773305 RepID=UPI001746CFE1|nr:TRAP transporter substrate-binding protein [Halomonas sp. ML-15]MBD3897569.1 TRAP transporter substrate-binding protein [Halomonas sp. ML-15]
MKKLPMTAFIASASMIFGISSQAQAESIEATIAVAPPDYVNAAAEAFKSYVESATDGEIEVRIVLHDALGGDREAIDQMRLGELEFNFAGGGGLAGVLPDVQMYNWPFLFPNRSVFYELMLDEDYATFVREWFLDKSGGTLRFFTGGENSLRHFYSTRGPVFTPSDMEDLSIDMRTRELRLDQDLFAALGASSIVALSAPERYEALQTGLIHATEGGLASAQAAGLMEVLEHVTLTGHAYDYFMLMGNQEFYDSLEPAHQQAIDEAAQLMAWVNNGYAIAEENQVLVEIQEMGIEVAVPNAEQLEEWQSVASPVAEDVMAELVDEEFIEVTQEAIERVSTRIDNRKTQ